MTDAVPMIDNLLIRGRDYLEKTPDFVLKGRDDEMKELMTLLMLKDNNGIFLTGSSGVGMTALVRGLQASKTSPGTPVDIVNKRFFWLDSDELFASGDSADINTKFKRIRSVLAETPNTVLVVENMGNFVEAATKTGNPHFLNGIFGDIKRGSYQVILECQYEDLGKVLKTDTDAQSICSLYELKEPKKENLRDIIISSKKGLEDFHGIRISDEAVDSALQLTAKYKIRALPAQPAGTLKIINSALAEYRMEAYTHPFKLTQLEADLAAVEQSIATGVNAAKFKDKTANELASMRETLGTEITEFKAAWDKRHREIASVSRDQRDAEDGIRKMEAEIAEIQAKEKANDEAMRAQQGDQAGDSFNGAAARRGDLSEGINYSDTSGMTSQAVLDLHEKIERYRTAGQESAERYKALTAEVNKDLLLTEEHVLRAFAKMSGIPANKLTQQDSDKLINLDANLAKRVFGQDEAIEAVSDAVRIARTGLGAPNEPEAQFIFMGPSGVGKTELVRALAFELFDDPDAMVRLDMSEFSEKHSVQRLLGAPPGYAGYEEGGQLTNAIHRNPRQIVLWDEIEKGHKLTYDILLQILSNGKATDGKGVTVDFRQTIHILTSNVGSQYFLDDNLKPEEARELAIKDLMQVTELRPEFLNRFNGQENILGFRKLGMDSILKIGMREIDTLKRLVKEKGVDVVMPTEDISALCEDYYSAEKGARGIPGVIKSSITSKVAKLLIAQPNTNGTIHLAYQSGPDGEKSTPTMTFVPHDTAPAAVPTTAPAPKP